MKIRSDFVSNSSSSSFILGENDLFDYYKVTVGDLTDALIELYGKKEYDEYLNKDWNTDHSPPFYVYALPDNLSEALSQWGNTLAGWTACNVGDYVLEKWNHFIEGMENAYQCILGAGSASDLKYAKKRKVPDFALQTVKDVKKKLGILSGKEALKLPNAFLFVHFAENEISQLAGMQTYSMKEIEEYEVKDAEDIEKAKKEGWESKSCTKFRLFEIIFKKLIDMGKIKLDDKKAITEIDVEEPVDPNEGWLYTYKDFVWESLLHCCLHEGQSLK